MIRSDCCAHFYVVAAKDARPPAALSIITIDPMTGRRAT
jgi:hypothetical protein